MSSVWKSTMGRGEVYPLAGGIISHDLIQSFTIESKLWESAQVSEAYWLTALASSILRDCV